MALNDLLVGPLPDDGPAVDEIHRDLLVPAFSPGELVSVETLRRGLRDGSTTALVASAGSEIVAAAVTEGRPTDDVHLLAYLASRPRCRGRGAGSALMTALIERWSAPDGPALVLAEVHDPTSWATTASERPVDRLRFYARFGASRLPFAWVQPRIGPEHDRVRGMALLVLHARPPARVEGAAVDQEMLLSWIATVQDEAEGPGAGADPELGAVRAAARAAPDPIPLLPLMS